MQLQQKQRIASGGQASCSRPAPPPSRPHSRPPHRRCAAAPPPRPPGCPPAAAAPQRGGRRPWRCVTARATPADAAAPPPQEDAPPEDAPEEADELQLQRQQQQRQDDGDDDPFSEIANLHNRSPDYDDPDWPARVSDWSEFWFNPEWSDEDLELDDDDDGGAAADDPQQQQQDAGERRLSRAHKLVEALSDLGKRDDVIGLLGPPPRAFFEADDPDNHPDLREDQYDPNPPWSAFDFRAHVEKRRKKAMLDQEWARRRALVGRFNGLDLDGDSRLGGEPLAATWSHEDMMKLITGDGAFAHPDDVKVSTENPLAVADYSGQYGIQHIPDTEDAIAEMGHLADEQVLARLDQGVVLGEQDFVDPTLAFGDPDTGVMYQAAPINRWQEIRNARLGEDVAGLEEAMAAARGGQAGLDALTQQRAAQADEELEVAHRFEPDIVWPAEWVAAAAAAAAAGGGEGEEEEEQLLGAAQEGEGAEEEGEEE